MSKPDGTLQEVARWNESYRLQMTGEQVMSKIKGGLRYPDGIYPKPCPCGKSDCWIYRPKERKS